MEPIIKTTPIKKRRLEIADGRWDLPLEEKAKLSKGIIKEWCESWDFNVYVSFSGGKDSTVLLDLALEVFPQIPIVFINTGLEYPEILQFLKTKKENITRVFPSMKFSDVLDKYGYPVISKYNAQKIHEFRRARKDSHKKRILYGSDKGYGKLPEKWRFLLSAPFPISHLCCDVLKKAPIKKYEKESGNAPIIGNKARDSYLRRISYNGVCNIFDSRRPISLPLSFWSDSDCWEYIKSNKLDYSKIYDKGYKGTGCMFCMFGVHMESEPNRFQMMKQNHPKHWEYCIYKLGGGTVLDYLGIPYGDVKKKGLGLL